MDVKTSTRRLAEVVVWLAKIGKRRDVDWVSAQVTVAEGLQIPVAVRERGQIISVDFDVGGSIKRRRYALTEDGLQKAIADWIREMHASDPDLLDLFEQLLRHG